MELSVVIVNYNVKSYLLQCLNSLVQALKPFGAEAEVLVVDNASADSSEEAVEEWKRSYPDFPLTWIANRENVGFGRANNQAVQHYASGRFLLFLNPDTVVSAEVLAACRKKMHADPQCGGIGVRMLNAQGRFLPESKRGFPSPFASFCKLTRLYRLFPRVHSMNRYYLSWLSDREEQRVEVLAGAFMYVRRTAELEREGYFDERFFMYGEDIDLSYRIGLASSYCAYLPLPILHYKGESTDGDSLRYIRIFYGAMELFQEKYYGRSFSSLFLWAGIRLATALAAAKWFVSTVCLGKKRRRKAEKVPQLFCVFAAEEQAACSYIPGRPEDEIGVFPPVALDYAPVAEKLFPLLRDKGKRNVHIVLDMKAYSYGAALDFLNSQAWELLRRKVVDGGSGLQIAFISGREPMVVVADGK